MNDPGEKCTKAGRRIGVFGGTFDPPHIGHLVAAVDAQQVLGLDVVLLVVAAVPWQKVGERAISPAGERVAMVRAAVADRPGLEVSELEIRRGGPSYTADTLAERILVQEHQVYPQAVRWFVEDRLTIDGLAVRVRDAAPSARARLGRAD